MPLGFDLSLRLGNRNFTSERKERVFLLYFCPFSREGNFGLHSTQFNYSSFYGIERKNQENIPQGEAKTYGKI